MPIAKPRSVAANPVMSEKWDEITEGRSFSRGDIPTLQQLCYWYAILDRCMVDITQGDSVMVAYSNDMDDIKALPQIATMKQASAEIRALNKQLGIKDEVAPEQKDRKVTPLELIQGRRQARAADAESRRRTA